MANEQCFLTLQDIKTAKDVPTKIIDVPEWGGKMEIKGMDVNARMNTLRQCSKPDGRGGTVVDQVKMQTATIVACTIQPQLTPDAIKWLTEKNSGVVERVFTEIYQLSGLLPEEGDTENVVASVNAKLSAQKDYPLEAETISAICDLVRAAIEEEKAKGGPSTEDFAEAPNEG